MAYIFPEKIFPSALNKYIQCPFKFKCHNDKDVKAEFIESPESFVGKIVHLALENFFDIKKTPINERKNQDIGQTIRHLWARLPKSSWGSACWDAKERKKIFGSTEQEKAFGLKAIAMTKNYISKADLSIVPLSLEDWMQCSVGEFMIAGRIDRIDQDSDSSISVWDYKTGRLPFYDTIEKMIKYDLQVPIYAIIASKLNPFAKKIRVGLIYVKYSKIYDITWTKGELKEVENKVIDVIKEARDDKDFLPRVNTLCPWCEYKNICPNKDKIKKKDLKVEEVSW